MFDTIGRDLDDEAGKRRAQSLLVSVLGLGACVGFALGLTAYTAADLVLDDVDVDDGEMVLLTLEGPEETPDLPDLPPPPPPPAAAAPEVEDDVEPEPEPDPDATPEELTEPLDDDIQSASRPAGEDGGVDGGDSDGEVGGTPGGVPDGTGDRLGGGGPRVFHHSELETRRRVQLVYPRTARAMGLGEQTCRAKIRIDATGRPFEVKVEDCPVVFHGPTREALLRWRWYPPRDGRQKVEAQTVIAVTYTLR